jgi:hypothetical protein
MRSRIIYLDLKKQSTAPIHDPKKQLKIAARTPYGIPIADVNAHPEPNTNNAGGMKMTVVSLSLLLLSLFDGNDGWQGHGRK